MALLPPKRQVKTYYNFIIRFQPFPFKNIVEDDCTKPCSFVLSEFDAFVKSRKTPFSVIPAQAGIQSLQGFLDSRLRGSDGLEDFLPPHQISCFRDCFDFLTLAGAEPRKLLT